MALGNLYVTIKDAYGAPAVNADSWWKVEGSDAIADMYVTVVLKSRNVKRKQSRFYLLFFTHPSLQFSNHVRRKCHQDLTTLRRHDRA